MGLDELYELLMEGTPVFIIIIIHIKNRDISKGYDV